MTARRDVLKGIGGVTLAAAASGLLPRLSGAGLPSGAVESAVLEALPGKKPLIKRSFRPPNYETPVSYFSELFTPNDAFFVRYHLAGIPQVEVRDWRLRVGGESTVKNVEFTLDELMKNFEPVEIAAVCQCSGNRRGLFEPHVPGVQWGYGAMGNARWRGVRLKDLLAKAGVAKEALEVVLNGADAGLLPATPDFRKSIPVWKALDENTMIAYEMNGKPLPHWNGYPARLVVPGWTATYWMKHIISINVVATPFAGFWMKSAYRIPKGVFPTAAAFTSQDSDVSTPITDIMVNSLVTHPQTGEVFKPGAKIEVRGIAWDGGFGIRAVEISADGGKRWRPAVLGKDAGRFAFRPWHFEFRPEGRGTHTLMVRATNKAGAAQATKLTPNPAGYHHNLIQTLDVVVS